MTVRDLCHGGRVDWKKGIREQKADVLGALYTVVSDLACYSWQVLTASFVRELTP